MSILSKVHMSIRIKWVDFQGPLDSLTSPFSERGRLGLCSFARAARCTWSSSYLLFLTKFFLLTW